MHKGFLETLVDPYAPYGFFYRRVRGAGVGFLWPIYEYLHRSHFSKGSRVSSLGRSAEHLESLSTHPFESGPLTHPPPSSHPPSGIERLSYSLPERTIQAVATVAFAVVHTAAFSYLYAMQPSLALAALVSWLMNSLSLLRCISLIALAAVDKVGI